MAEVTPPFPVEVSNAYNAWDFGAPYKDLIAEGTVGATDLAVTQRGAGANNSVDIAAGTCWVYGDDNPTQQPAYRCYNNATKNLVLAQDATNPRIALIVAHAYDAHFSGATYTWALEAILGTPAGSPVAPALPNNCMLLATVTVPAVGGNVTNAQITDNRSRISDARSLGATTGQVPVWNGTKWAAGTGGALALIVDYTVAGSSVASLDTNTLLGGNIPATYKHLLVKIKARSTAAVGGTDLTLRVNNDSGANYDYNYFFMTGSGTTGGNGLADGTGTRMEFSANTVPGTTAPAGAFLQGRLEADSYLDALHKQFMWQGQANNGGTNSTFYQTVGGGRWKNVAAVTRLAYTLGAGNFDIGSRFTLYGIS